MPADIQSPLRVYLDHLERGELAYQFSPAAGRAVFYPRVLCPFTGSDQLEWRGGMGGGAGPRPPGGASAGRRAVQRGADRLRRRLPADEPRRGHPARRREDRHARALPRASSRRRGAALSGVRAGGQAMSGLRRGGAAIVGAAESDLGKVADEMSPLDLMAQGRQRALADRAASLKDVDGLFCPPAQARLSVLALAEYLGIQPKYI